jgi:hypothetical protein
VILTISIVVGVLAVVVGVLAVLLIRRQPKNGQPSQTNYRVFFIMGLVMLGLGVVNGALYFVMQIPFYVGLPLLVIGVVYTVLGAVHRSSWGKSQDQLP